MLLGKMPAGGVYVQRIRTPIEVSLGGVCWRFWTGNVMVPGEIPPPAEMKY
jgi:hypothetical protein